MYPKVIYKNNNTLLKIAFKIVQTMKTIGVYSVVLLKLRQIPFHPVGNACQNKMVCSRSRKNEIIGTFHISTGMLFHRRGASMLKAQL